ncbi:hypothetical protein jhhlp_008193 [Lomentospora prolificans]|uniref:Uncharacterized protein n=1 Tax=Lomentospora prolificans TaxID=41688 RepID=A0A2N3MZQ8_9PEZI|nr:hypothetical protein jhhlp_008193 [Lomentospora prolificans]
MANRESDSVSRVFKIPELLITIGSEAITVNPKRDPTFATGPRVSWFGLIRFLCITSVRRERREWDDDPANAMAQAIFRSAHGLEELRCVPWCLTRTWMWT